MLRRRLLFDVLLGISIADWGMAQSVRPSEGDVLRGRQQVIEEMLTGPMPGVARWARDSCAFNDGTAEVAKARAEGRVTAPDAGDGCVAALTRQAHDGALMALYQDILRRERPDKYHETGSLVGRFESRAAAQSNGGNDPDAAALPQRILAALRDGSNRVDLGAGHVLTVTPGLAFDVGFSRAYWAGATARPVSVEPQKLRAATESCVAQREDRKVCFTAGYAQGAAAYREAAR